MNGDKQAVQLVPMPFSETGKLEAAGIQVFLSSKNSNGLVVSLIWSFPDMKFKFRLCRCQSVLWKLPYSLSGLWHFFGEKNRLLVLCTCSGLLADFSDIQWQHLKRAGCGWKQTSVIRSRRWPQRMRGAILSAEINTNCTTGRKDTDCNLLGRKQCCTVVSH